jgi:hypothetical protein
MVHPRNVSSLEPRLLPNVVVRFIAAHVSVVVTRMIVNGYHVCPICGRVSGSEDQQTHNHMGLNLREPLPPPEVLVAEYLKNRNAA